MPIDETCVQLAGLADAVAAARTRIESLLGAAAAESIAASPAAMPRGAEQGGWPADEGQLSPSWPALPASASQAGGASGPSSGADVLDARVSGSSGVGSGSSALRACYWEEEGSPAARVRDAGTLSMVCSSVVGSAVGSVVGSAVGTRPTIASGASGASGASDASGTSGAERAAHPVLNGRAANLRIDAHVAASSDASSAKSDARAYTGSYSLHVGDVGVGGGEGVCGYVVSPHAEATLEELVEEDGEGVMEIDVPREAVGKIIGIRGRVITQMRAVTKCEIRLLKDGEGNGTLQVSGLGRQLDLLASIVQMVVTCPESDPDVVAMIHAAVGVGASGGTIAGAYVGGASPPPHPPAATAAAEEEEYILPLAPHEAKLLDGSRQLASVMRTSGVRLQVERSRDGWVSLTIRGDSSAIADAKQRIDAIVNPITDLVDEPAIGMSVSRRSIGGVASLSLADGGGSPPHSRGEGGPLVKELTSASYPRGGGEGFRIDIELTNKDQVGAVIGEAGRTINAIRAAVSGATMQVEPPDESKTSSRRVVISGDEASCMAARAMVQEVLRSNTGKRDYSQQIDETHGGGATEGSPVRLSVPRHLVGRVIGKRGETIKRCAPSLHAHAHAHARVHVRVIGPDSVSTCV